MIECWLIFQNESTPLRYFIWNGIVNAATLLSGTLRRFESFVSLIVDKITVGGDGNLCFILFIEVNFHLLMEMS